jgi:hypothetical protein
MLMKDSSLKKVMFETTFIILFPLNVCCIGFQMGRGIISDNLKIFPQMDFRFINNLA